MSENKEEVYDAVVRVYRDRVSKEFPQAISAWPIITGNDVKYGVFNGWIIIVFKHTGASALKHVVGMDISRQLIGFDDISEQNKEAVRKRLEKHYGLNSYDAVVFVPPTGDVTAELDILALRHAHALGLTPMRIFLSHKGCDKKIVRNFKATLELLGFDPWLDEDAMSAGVELERGILAGFHDSCAAVFFITPNFIDQDYLGSEVNYAIAEKRSKKDRFSIITLVFEESGAKGTVPDLLRPYVWKEPISELDALREIIKALPVGLGMVSWK